jgi:hypothetical protein
LVQVEQVLQMQTQEEMTAIHLHSVLLLLQVAVVAVALVLEIYQVVAVVQAVVALMVLAQVAAIAVVIHQLKVTLVETEPVMAAVAVVVLLLLVAHLQETQQALVEPEQVIQ